MNEETLQGESAEVVETEVVAETPTESAPEEKSQESIQKVINKKHFQAKEAERNAQAEKQRADDLQRQLDEANVQTPVEVPDLPDPYDDNYETQIQARDNIIRQRAAYDAAQQQQYQTQETNRQQAQAKQQAELRSKAEKYTERAIDMGITAEELQEAGQAVANYGISEDLTMAILGDEEGALLTKYLAANPSEMDTLANMSSYDAAMHIERNVRSKAAALKPKTTKAPEPPADIEGNGVDGEFARLGLIKGAQFE